jgi:hypothetical protein
LQSCDQLRVIGKQIRNTGAAGIGTYPDFGTGNAPDYVTAHHNQSYHCGYSQGWSSGISYLNHAWYDQYAGCHSSVTNNIVSGMDDNSSYQRDGNGIVMDNDSAPPILLRC